VALTPQQRLAQEAYREAVRDSLRLWASNETAYFEAISRQLQDYRANILADLPDVTAFDARRREQVLQMLDRAEARLSGGLRTAFDTALDKSVETAVASIDGPLAASIPTAQIAFLERVAPTLIQGVTSETHTAVQQLLQRYMAGGIRRQDVIARIGVATGPGARGVELKPGQLMPRAEKRAQQIFRTEINTASSVVQQARVDQLAERDKGVGSRWVHYPSNQPRPTHSALHGVTIFPGHGERFEVGGVRVTGPHDPALGPEDKVNCHCKVVTVYDPSRSEDAADRHIAAAPSGQGAATKTPAPPAPPKLPLTAAQERNRARARQLVADRVKTGKPIKSAAGDDGPVTVSAAGPRAGSRLPKRAPKLSPAERATRAREQGSEGS
jgi:hypothetical protein